MKKRYRLVCILAAGALLLSGCAGAGTQDAAEYSAGYDSVTMETAAAEAPAAEAPMAAPEPMPEEAFIEEAFMDKGVYASSNGSIQPQYGNHKIIATYSLEMETDEFDLHVEMLQNQAAALGGYVQSSYISGSKPVTYRDSGRYANFSFRIPSDSAADFVEFTKGTGVITYSNVETQDVTLEYFDSETRLGVLRTQLDRLTGILVETDNLADIIALEQEIARVTLEIEQLTTELRKYDDLIDYTTVNVGINENRLAMAPADELTMGQRIAQGFGENLHSLRITLEDGIVWFVTSLPAILLALAAVAIAVWLVRLMGRLRARGRASRAEKRAKAQEKMAEVAAKGKTQEDKKDGEY